MRCLLTVCCVLVLYLVRTTGGTESVNSYYILWCPAYAKLREGKSMDRDQDVLDYFHKVMVIRNKLKLRK